MEIEYGIELLDGIPNILKENGQERLKPCLD